MGESLCLDSELESEINTFVPCCVKRRPDVQQNVSIQVSLCSAQN